MTGRARRRLWPRANMAAAVAWLALIPVALALGWIRSVAFVAAISIYANVAAHVAAYRADTSTKGDDDAP